MTSGTPSSAFEHDPLVDSTTHFRLLHILRGDFGQHVECEISSWPIDDAPSYYAISYTWGDPADTTEITVNGKPLAVRRNCEYVLQQAFATKASRYYWVDAICIAQTSIQERNHQVGIMGKIYSGAKHVFACVGPHADDNLCQITSELASLRDAIALRSSEAPETVLRLQDNPDSENTKVRTSWMGIRIIEGNRISEHADGRRQSNLNSCYVEHVQNGHFVLTRMGSQITIRAHVETKAGDWCLVEDLSPLRNGGYGLILRELDDHKYVVVGSALIYYKDDRSRIIEEEQSRLSRFKGWSDPEDLMVLAWMLDEVEGKKHVSDEDIEKFVNMRICGWKNSSYFEKVVKDV
ncbi:hypothetical protein J4E83_003071 [Alternaria metachromatica]|uniref:uncharacterized protein n=1 Tax=Alternaria metachromatica TaxID=283354 RepID=UPI0020C39A43|nr:uncharacterized protein J4E83_003071 [Alternaria metachromatica]KAI4628521.1 hypothetical protein J4E83_003071 [Alternaria metachromatica]